MKLQPGVMQLVFCHIPKCGGKTFKDILYHQFDLKPNIFRTGYGYKPKLIDKLQEVDILYGHFNFNFMRPHLRKRHLLFMWEREPIERVISQYNYWNSLRGTVLPARRLREEEWTIQEFFRRRDPDVDGWIFAGLSLFGVDFKTGGQTVSECVKLAKKNIDMFDFIGITEQYDKSLQCLEDKFGFDISYKSVNVTPNWAKMATITEEEREEFKELLKPEYELYEYAKERATS